MRKSNKHFFKKNKDGSITFRSQESLSRYIKQSVEEQTDIYKDLMYQEVLDDVEKQTETIARDVLKRTWGFGKKRQDDFLNGFNYQVECIRSKHVTLEDIKDMLEEE